MLLSNWILKFILGLILSFFLYSNITYLLIADQRLPAVKLNIIRPWHYYTVWKNKAEVPKSINANIKIKRLYLLRHHKNNIQTMLMNTIYNRNFNTAEIILCTYFEKNSFIDFPGKNGYRARVQCIK